LKTKINSFMVVFLFVLYVLIKLCSWLCSNPWCWRQPCYLREWACMTITDNCFDVDNMSYEVLDHVKTNGNPTFIFGSYVFYDVFRGHGTNLCFIFLMDFTSCWNPIIRCIKARICAFMAMLEYLGVVGFGRQN
jgi:hypothetical protein